MPRRYAKRRPSRHENKIYGRRLDEGSGVTEEEDVFFCLKGAQRLKDEDVEWLRRERRERGGEGFTRYLNSVVMTDLKRNRRYTKALQLHMFFEEDFNGVVYASTVKRMANYVSNGQTIEMVRGGMWRDFMRGLEGDFRDRFEGYGPRQVLAVVEGMGEIKSTGGEWGGGAEEGLRRVLERVEGKVMGEHVVEKGNCVEVGGIVRGIGRIGGGYGGRGRILKLANGNIGNWLLGTEGYSDRGKGISDFLDGCRIMMVRPVPVCTWLNSEAEWFVQDAMQGKKAKHIVRVAVSLSTLVDDRYDDAFFSLLNGTVLEKLRKRIDFHDACKLLWALTVKSSFRPEYSRVNVLWEKIVDEWGGEDVGKMVKTRKGGIRKINEAEKMAPHMRRNSTHREGKKRHDVVISSTGARSSILNPRPEEEAMVKESLALLGTAYAVAEVEGLNLDIGPMDMYEAMERAKVEDKVLIAKKENGIQEVIEDLKEHLNEMYGGTVYKRNLDPRMKVDRMWGSEGLSGLKKSEPGFLAIDLGNPDYKIAFEIADESQMVWDAETGEKAGLDGRTAAKIRLLEKYDWKVCVVDMEEWKTMGEDEDKQKFLFDSLTKKMSI